MIENHGPQFSIVNVSSCIGSFPSRCIGERVGVESPVRGVRVRDPTADDLIARFRRGRISFNKLSTERLPRCCPQQTNQLFKQSEHHPLSEPF